MTLRAVFFDFGGVIVRTEYSGAPRTTRGAPESDLRGTEYIVFEAETARQASIGQVSVDAHWLAVTRKLRLPLRKRKPFTPSSLQAM